MRIKKTFQGNLPENKIVGTYTESNTDTYSCEYLNDHLGGVVLWTNPSPTSPFSPQTININGLSNYKYIDIVYFVFTGNPKQMVKRHYYDNTYRNGELVSVFTYNTRGYIGTREYIVNKNSIVFNDNWDFNRSGTADSFATTSDNNWTLPYKIIGYK